MREIDGNLEVVLETSTTIPPMYVDSPELLWALQQLSETFTRIEALAMWEREPSLVPLTASLWTFLVENEIIVSASESTIGMEEFFHATTRSYPFLDMGEPTSPRIDNQKMQGYRASDAYPPVFSTEGHARATCFRLSSLSHAIRRFKRPSCVSSSQTLALLIGGAVGMRGHVIEERMGPHGTWLQLELIFRSVPSGGSRHPTETYLLVSGCEVPDGVYHYGVRDNSIYSVATSTSVVLDALGVETTLGSSIIVMLVSKAERAMWRYRDPRSFRAVLLDVGHIEQQFLELTRWAGLSFSFITRFDAHALVRALTDARDAIAVSAFKVSSPCSLQIASS